MEAHINKFDTQAEYQDKKELIPPPHIALVDENNGVSYSGVEEVKYELYDILWSDGKATQEVRPVSDGVVPIGLCVIPTGWLDEGEKARFASLKYMSATTPVNGSLNPTEVFWGEAFNSPEDDPLKEYYVPYAYNDEIYYDGIETFNYEWNGIYGYVFGDMRDRDNWLRTLNYCKENPGKYAIGDINGKQNTINISIEENYCTHNDTYYADYDMKPCVAKYAPIGTQAGDWYVPAAGELLQFAFRLRSDQNNPSINDKVAEIAKIYPQDCVMKFEDNNIYWMYRTSTVKDDGFSYGLELTERHVLLDTQSRHQSPGKLVAFLLR